MIFEDSPGLIKMILVQVFVLFASFFSFFETASIDNEDYNENTTSVIDNGAIEVSNFTPLYPRNVGIVNTALNCYASALFSSLYGIPMIQSRVYELASKEMEQRESARNRDDSLITALARVFAKMRLSEESVSLERHMFKTLSTRMNWQFGNTECVVEFWDQFLYNLPAGDLSALKKVFEVEWKIEYEADGVEKTLIKQLNYLTLLVPIEEGCISSLLTDQYLSKNRSDSLDEKAIVSSSLISNSPDVLIFSLSRVSFCKELESMVFCNRYIYADDVTINGEKYVAMALIVFDFELNHFNAVTFDPETKKNYLHDDEDVQEIVIADSEEKAKYLNDTCEESKLYLTAVNFDKSLHTNSVMIFYVNESAVKSKIREIKEAVRANLDIPQALDDRHKAKSRKRPLGLGKASKAKKVAQQH